MTQNGQRESADYYKGVADALDVLRAHDFPSTDRVDHLADQLAPGGEGAFFRNGARFGAAVVRASAKGDPVVTWTHHAARSEEVRIEARENSGNGWPGIEFDGGYYRNPDDLRDFATALNEAADWLEGRNLGPRA